MEYIEMEFLRGLVFTNIEKTDDEIIFTCDNGDKYKMYHSQNCCECVSIDDIDGELNDLIGTPIIQAEEATSSEHPPERLAEIEKEKQENGDGYYDYENSFTWTFYKFATIKGYVTIKWYGTSNGYYSESVDLVKADENGAFSRW